MTHEPIAAFGYVVFKVELAPGEEKVMDLRDTGGEYRNGYYFFVQGTCTYTVQETGERLADRVPGYLNFEHPEGQAKGPCTVLMKAQDAVMWYCVSHMYNTEKANPLPTSIKSHTLDGPTLFPNTNLFLAHGTVHVGSKQFVGPTQIRVRSGQATLAPEGTAYLLEFPYADAGVA